MSLRKLAAAALSAVVIALVLAAPSGATTFCVPGFHAACPDNGANVAKADLEDALKSNGSDGIPDEVLVDAMTYVNPASLDLAGTDDLEITGAGPDKTILTTSSTASTWVVDLSFGADRDVTMRDLKVLIPVTIGINSAGIHTERDLLENVDVETKRENVQAVSPAEGGTTFRDGALFGSEGGSFTYGFWLTPGSSSGDLVIENTTIRGVERGIAIDRPNSPLTLRQVRVTDVGETTIVVNQSNDLTVENAVFESGSEPPIYIYSNETDDVDARISNLTMKSTGDSTDGAIRAVVANLSGSGSIDIDAEDSIIRGFDKTWDLTSPVGSPVIGDVFISLENSNFLPSGTNTGNGNTYLPAGNINLDPKFMGEADYTLAAGSPSIDAGTPGSPVLFDVLGARRPVDGNGDGVAVNDQGAYEYRPPVVPPTCETDPSLCPVPPGDTTAPKISKVRFKAATKKKAGSLKLNLSEVATIRATFKPTPVKKRKTLKLSRAGKTGANSLVIRKRKLKPGKYRLSITATDAAGNRSKPVVRKIKVKG